MRFTVTRITAILSVVTVLPIATACTTIEPGGASSATSLPALEGEAAIDAYFRQIEELEEAAPQVPVPMYAPPPRPPPPPPPAPSGSQVESAAPVQVVESAADSVVVTASVAEESITNTQEAGVDEGGIVKRRGNHLVILRRGRLFSVALDNGGLTRVDTIDAFPPGDDDPGDTWYDEMLIAGDTVIVIGYSYGGNGTEVSRFDLSGDGRFTYRDTHYLTSGDYYSSRNYASRLIGEELLFYAPIDFYGVDWRDGLPTVRRRASDGSLSDPKRSDGASRIYLPQRYLDTPAMGLETLHTVTSCDLGGADLACRSTMALGGYGRDFYFSPGSAYVWVDGEDVWFAEDEDGDANEDEADAILYRIPLDGSAPTALGVTGSPVDQFSFRENGGESIDILVRASDYGGGMWGGEVSEGDPMLLQLPLDALGDGADDAGKERYRTLPPVDGWRFFNRYVGRHLLYAAGSYGDEEETPQIYIVPLDHDWVVAMPLPHGITRFDAMGSDAVAIGPSAQDALGFSSIALDAESGAARLANTYLMPDAEEGETRSQALFYRPDAGSEGGVDGTLGLPVSRELRNDLGEFLGDASAIAFLRREDRILSPAGSLDSSAQPGDPDAADSCEASCVDWYGNARPIFIGDRIFALMGYELVEGRMADGKIGEVRRLDFTPR
ncbi:MAG: hypothetical protein CL808_08600 [Citromicrobium sp.]|nr:hypothetical protein [Citromicrobium sp.]